MAAQFRSQANASGYLSNQPYYTHLHLYDPMSVMKRHAFFQIPKPWLVSNRSDITISQKGRESGKQGSAIAIR